MNITKMFQLTQKRWLVVLQIILNIGVAFVMVRVSEFARVAIDKGIGEGELGSVLVQFGILIVLGTALSYGNILCGAKFSTHFIEHLRNIALGRLVHAEYHYYEKETTGSISSRMNRDMSIVADYMGNGMPEFMSNMIVFVITFIYLLIINPGMTLICAICIPMAVILAKKVAAPTYDTMEQFSKRLDEATQMTQDSMTHTKIEKVYGLEKVRKHYFNAKMDEAVAHYIRYEKLVAKAGGYKYIIRTVPIFICILVGFYNAYRGVITSGEIVAFVLLLQNISKPLAEFTRYVTEFKEAMVAMDRVMEITHVKEEVFGKEVASESDTVFALKDVSFAYEPEEGEISETVLSDINLTIRRGEVVALVGASGSGKSTLFKLLIGFHQADKGKVCLYGKDLKDWQIQKARREMAYVAQDTYLFEGTVADNIGYGKMDATFDEMVVAAKKAYAHDFIMALPEGYQTVLSERGSNLSGGQRQRIGIARAFLKDAPIFILDEMTSALDVESERLIQRAIEEYSRSKTVILIAHRLSTIKQADKIYVLGEGKVVEVGTHDALIQKQGVYSKLYSKQEAYGKEMLDEPNLSSF